MTYFQAVMVDVLTRLSLDAVASIALIDKNAFGPDTCVFSGSGQGVLQSFAVVRLAVNGRCFKHKIPARAGLVGERYRCFDAELIGLVSLAFADTFDFWRMPAEDLSPHATPLFDAQFYGSA